VRCLRTNQRVAWNFQSWKLILFLHHLNIFFALVSISLGELRYYMHFPGSFPRHVVSDAFPCKELQSGQYLTIISWTTAYGSIQGSPAVILVSSKITFYSFCPSQHRGGHRQAFRSRSSEIPAGEDSHFCTVQVRGQGQPGTSHCLQAELIELHLSRKDSKIYFRLLW